MPTMVNFNLLASRGTLSVVEKNICNCILLTPSLKLQCVCGVCTASVSVAEPCWCVWLCMAVLYFVFGFFMMKTGGKPRQRGDQSEDDEGHRQRHPPERKTGRGDDRRRYHLRSFRGARRGLGPASQLSGLPGFCGLRR